MHPKIKNIFKWIIVLLGVAIFIYSIFDDSLAEIIRGKVDDYQIPPNEEGSWEGN